MAFEDRARELYDRAARIEAMEGTIKYSYVEIPEDSREYTSSALKKGLISDIAVLVIFAVFLILGLAIEQVYTARMILIAFCCAGMFFMLMILAVLIVSAIKNKNKRSDDLDEVKLAFNSYGVVLRTACKTRCTVYAYAWNDFDSMIEYQKVTVAIKSGIAFIFPKRIFSLDEFETFRRFAYASMGKKCIFKNFKP